jgi:hypothetical protein
MLQTWGTGGGRAWAMSAKAALYGPDVDGLWPARYKMSFPGVGVGDIVDLEMS